MANLGYRPVPSARRLRSRTLIWRGGWIILCVGLLVFLGNAEEENEHDHENDHVLRPKNQHMVKQGGKPGNAAQTLRSRGFRRGKGHQKLTAHAVNYDPTNAMTTANSISTTRGYGHPPSSRLYDGLCYNETRTIVRGWVYCRRALYYFVGFHRQKRNKSKCGGTAMTCLTGFWCCRRRLSQFVQKSDMTRLNRSGTHRKTTIQDKQLKNMAIFTTKIKSLQRRVHQEMDNQYMRLAEQKDRVVTGYKSKAARMRNWAAALRLTAHIARVRKIIDLQQKSITLSISAADSMITERVKQNIALHSESRKTILGDIWKLRRYLAVRITQLEQEVVDLRTSSTLVQTTEAAKESQIENYWSILQRIERKDDELTKTVKVMDASLKELTTMTEEYTKKQNVASEIVSLLDNDLKATEKQTNEGIALAVNFAKMYGTLHSTLVQQVQSSAAEVVDTTSSLKDLNKKTIAARKMESTQMDELATTLATTVPPTSSDGSTPKEHQSAAIAVRLLIAHMKELKMKLYSDMYKVLHKPRDADGAETGPAPVVSNWKDEVEDQVTSRVAEGALSNLDSETAGMQDEVEAEAKGEPEVGTAPPKEPERGPENGAAPSKTVDGGEPNPNPNPNHNL